MKTFVYLFFAVIILQTGLNCTSKKEAAFKPKELYHTKSLIVTQVAEQSYIHTSYKQTNDFGNVPCNGLIVRDHDQVIVFDTPTNDSSANELISWISKNLQSSIKAIIPTHFHDDCLGGLKAFHDNNIPSYAHIMTTDLAKANQDTFPRFSFSDSLILKVGNEPVMVKYFGEGHTKDNVVGYFHHDQILFGGCLIKELEAGKGYLGDANVSAWPKTVGRISTYFPHVKIVVPGHGDYGSRDLLDYTIKLFSEK